MVLTANTTKRRLKAGKMALGFGVHHLRTVAAPVLAGATGHDWMFIDAEHGAFTIQEITQLCIAALPTGVTPIVRVCAGALDEATRALDNGALGIVVPHVDTAAEAREVVEKLKYPPIGHRSMGGTGPHYGLRAASTGDAAAALNAANLTVVMLETPTAIANAAEIATVPGVDVLLIGTNDLCAEMGIPGDFANQRVVEAYQTMIEACRKGGKFPGMAGIYNEPIMKRYIDMGARFILSGNDANFLFAAAAQRTAFLHKLLG